MEPDSSGEKSDRARGNEHKLEDEIFWSGEKISLLGMYGTRMPREVVESPSLEVTQNLTGQGPEQWDLSSPALSTGLDF